MTTLNEYALRVNRRLEQIPVVIPENRFFHMAGTGFYL